jgi:hypothetical protein
VSNLLENPILIIYNEKRAYTSIFNINIGLLRTENALFRVIRPLLFLIIIKAQYTYSETARRRTIILLFEINRRGSLNSCFRAVSIRTRRGPIIFGLRRLLKRRNKLRRSLII